MRDPAAAAPIFTSAPRKPGRVARELHGRRIGERFAAARDGRLNQPAEEQPDVADDENRERREQ